MDHDTIRKNMMAAEAWPEGTTRDEKRLRGLLARRVGITYGDDGELQSGEPSPAIDFKRDSVDDIERKLGERGMAKLAAELRPARFCPLCKASGDAVGEVGSECWTKGCDGIVASPRVEHFQGDGNPSLEDRMCLNCRRLWGEHGPGEACRPLTAEDALAMAERLDMGSSDLPWASERKVRRDGAAMIRRLVNAGGASQVAHPNGSQLVWVIEKGSPAQYFNGFNYGAGKWTPDFSEAYQSKDREEMQRLWDSDPPIFTIFNDACRIADHIICGGPAPVADEPPKIQCPGGNPHCVNGMVLHDAGHGAVFMGPCAACVSKAARPDERTDQILRDAEG